jgi:hypothetical protein
MSNKIFLYSLLLFSMVISGCNRKLDQAAMPADFAFLFEYASCGGPEPTDILDTKAGTLIHDPIDGTPPLTIDLKITESEKELVFKKIIEMDFFNFPSIFTVPQGEIRGIQIPYSTTHLTITYNSEFHSVTWTNEVLMAADYLEGQNLKQLTNLILEIIESKPAYREIPEPNVGCA